MAALPANAREALQQPDPAFQKTIVVSPVAGDPEASGDRLLALLDSVSPTADQPWLLWVEPGVYDLGSTPLTMKPYMDIQGSGIEATTIQGLGQSSANLDRGKGVVIGADDAEIRSLTVRCVPDQAQGLDACIAMANPAVSPRMSDLLLTSEGFGTHWGLRNTNADPRIDDVTVEVSGGYENYAIVNAFGSHPTIRRAVLQADGGQLNNFGIFDRDASLSAVIQDTELLVTGGDRSIGIYATNPAFGQETKLLNVTMTIEGAAENYGILDGDSLYRLHGTQITAQAPGSAVDLASTGTVEIFNSELEGNVMAVRAMEVRVASTLVRGGGEVTGEITEICGGVAVFGQGDSTFYPNQCPDASGAKRQSLSRSPVLASGYATELDF
jgi:hypothetical protein